MNHRCRELKFTNKLDWDALRHGPETRATALGARDTTAFHGILAAQVASSRARNSCKLKICTRGNTEGRIRTTR